MRLKMLRLKLKIKLSLLLRNVYDCNDHRDTNPVILDRSTKNRKMKDQLQKIR